MQRELIKEADATILYEAFIDLNIVGPMARYAFKKRHLTCGPGAGFSENFLICYGLNQQNIGPSLFALLQQLLHHKKAPSSVLHLARNQAYTSTFNLSLAKHFDIPITDGFAASLEEGICLESVINDYITKDPKVVYMSSADMGYCINTILGT